MCQKKKSGVIVNKNPTLKQIAQNLGLSSATVSKALAGRMDISTETKEKVVSYAREIGYLKGKAVRRRLGILAVNVSDMNDNFSSVIFNTLLGFQQYANRLDYDTVMLTCDSTDQTSRTLDSFVFENRLDGMFVLGLKNTDFYYEQLNIATVPIVVMDITSLNSTVGYIGTDSILGGILAIDHLVKLGHKRIGFVNGSIKAYISQERLAGYITALHMHKLPFDQDLCFDGDFSLQSGVAAADYFSKKNVTAIYFSSDLMALGAIQQFTNLGYSLPQNMSIIGFDDLPICLSSIPPITTVAQDPIALGEAACATLYGLSQNIPVKNVKLAPHLIIRDSTTQLQQR